VIFVAFIHLTVPPLFSLFSKTIRLAKSNSTKLQAERACSKHGLGQTVSGTAVAFVDDVLYFRLMFIFFRAITYATLFISLFLFFMPARLLSWSGISQPEGIGVVQIIGMVVGAAGGLMAVSCVLMFALIGRGTPAPFDPPRRLVTKGPYRLMRNPMYVGAGLALTGAALFYQSLYLLGYAGLFLLIAHLFVIWYEEPALQRYFEQDYIAYCEAVPRWWPKR
jgi:protein-S-isoprenylcysteine O-methyltransferase Ste14